MKIKATKWRDPFSPVCLRRASVAGQFVYSACVPTPRSIRGGLPSFGCRSGSRLSLSRKRIVTALVSRRSSCIVDHHRGRRRGRGRRRRRHDDVDDDSAAQNH